MDDPFADAGTIGGRFGGGFAGTNEALDRLCYQVEPGVYAIDFAKCAAEIARRLADTGQAYRMEMLVRREAVGRFVDVGPDDPVLSRMIMDEARLLYDVFVALAPIEGCATRTVISADKVAEDGGSVEEKKSNPTWVKTIAPWQTRGGGFIKDVCKNVVSAMGDLSADKGMHLFKSFGMPNYGVPTVGFMDGVWSVCLGFGESSVPDDALWKAPHRGTHGIQFFRPYRPEDRFLRWSPLSFLSPSDLAALGRLRASVGVPAGVPSGLGVGVCLVGGVDRESGELFELLEELVGDQMGSMLDCLAEGFMARPKEVALLLHGGQGSGKSTISDLMRTVLGRDDRNLGNDHPDPMLVVKAGFDQHPAINKMYLHRSCLFLGDYGHGVKLGSCLTRDVSTRAVKPYRAMYGTLISGGIPVFSTLVFEANDCMGLTGAPSEDTYADDRRVFGVEVTAFAKSDPRRDAKYALMRSYVEGGDGSGDEDTVADGLRGFCKDLLDRVRWETWIPSDWERQPFINACEAEREGVGGVDASVIARFAGLEHTGDLGDVIVLRELYQQMKDDGWKGHPANALRGVLQERGLWDDSYRMLQVTPAYRRDVVRKGEVACLVGWRSSRYSAVSGKGRIVGFGAVEL